ncbi:hypothetical protein FJ936_04030 [Mesorhizobium sp. B2-4-13]|uniref:hypothetical protein n=1 Tax=Mesorhizobium sp. B2-4-13 TaxID=2589936 RepID=UPI00114E83B1|nr:hypothetical protein [Mesorhizobium sp. B2-4-13]TPK86562.1 hypothetical protein FJ936_04030 [Mesorhizobium sp. B2-4-13]
MLSTQVATFPAKQIGYFKGERWFCRPLDTGHSEIAIQVHAFDEVDAQHEASAQLASLLDILACMTNATFNQLARAAVLRDRNLWRPIDFAKTRIGSKIFPTATADCV